MKHHLTSASYLVLSAIIAVVTGSVYAYMYMRVQSQSAAAVTALTELTSEQANKDHEKTLNTLYTTTLKDRERIVKQFVPYDQAVSFIEQVEGIGRATGATVSITSIEQSDLSSAEAGTTGTITATIDAHGTWSEIMRTLRYAENLPLSVTTKSLQLERFGGKGNVWRIGFRLEALSLK